jgi:hypothetical protein
MYLTLVFIFLLLSRRIGTSFGKNMSHNLWVLMFPTMFSEIS